jgi:hypothetical protein
VLTLGQLAVVIVAVLAAAAAIIGAAVVVPPAVRAAAPDLPVRAYLAAIEAGDIPKALELGHVTPSTTDKLLTSAAYGQASDRITDFTVIGATTQATTGTVRVRVAQGEGSYIAEFGITRAAGNPLAPWRLAKQKLPEIGVSVQAPVDLAIDVAGVALTLSHGGLTQHVFPGTYTASSRGTQYFEGTDASATAVFEAGAAPRAALRLELAAGGQAHAAAEVNDWLTTCAASSELHPEGCPFQAVPEASVSYSNGRWTIQSRPTFAAGRWNDQLGGWPVTTSAPGYVTFTARAAQRGLTGTATTGSNPFSVAGTIVPDAVGELHFVPSPNYAAPGAAGSLT